MEDLGFYSSNTPYFYFSVYLNFVSLTMYLLTGLPFYFLLIHSFGHNFKTTDVLSDLCLINMYITPLLLHLRSSHLD